MLKNVWVMQKKTHKNTFTHSSLGSSLAFTFFCYIYIYNPINNSKWMPRCWPLQCTFTLTFPFNRWDCGLMDGQWIIYVYNIRIEFKVWFACVQSKLLFCANVNKTQQTTESKRADKRDEREAWMNYEQKCRHFKFSISDFFFFWRLHVWLGLILFDYYCFAIIIVVSKSCRFFDDDLDDVMSTK